MKQLLAATLAKLKKAYAQMSPTQPEFKLDAEHFQDAPDEMVDFMWGEGKETIAALENSCRINKESSNKLLNLLLAGAGGAALLFINSLPKQHYFYFGLIVLVVGWAACALLLIKFCVQTNKRAISSHSPEDLYVNDKNNEGQKLPLSIVKRYVLWNMSETICELEWVVSKSANNLDGIRRLAAYTACAGIMLSVLHYLLAWIF